jgi:tetratricopeptide (TPR) repeat protein
VAYASSGLCSDLLVLLLLEWGYERSVADYTIPTSVSIALRHALILEAIAFLYSAIPMSNAGRDGIPNDGYHILAILRGDYSGDTEDSKRWETNVRRYDPAFSIDDSWLLHDDPDLNKRCEEWRFRLANRQFDRAVTAFADFMATDLIKGGERAMYLDEMASLAVVDGHKQLLPYALEWTREARRVAPSSRTLIGTLGSVLVESGDIEAGMALLSSLTTAEPNDRAIAACYLAKGHHQLGNQDEARQVLERARKLRPPPALFNRIAREIGTRALSAD